MKLVVNKLEVEEGEVVVFGILVDSLLVAQVSGWAVERVENELEVKVDGYVVVIVFTLVGVTVV